MSKMIELWSHPACESCEKAREFLGQTPIEWRYIQVGDDFQGTIPRIVLEDGRHVIGFPAIKAYVKQWMKEMGIPEGI